MIPAGFQDIEDRLSFTGNFELCALAGIQRIGIHVLRRPSGNPMYLQEVDRSIFIDWKRL